MKQMKKYQGAGAKLFLVPFVDIQLLIRYRCQESYRTVLFRRAMFKFAEKIADKYGYKAFVTGEALGQVASQTIENMTLIGDAVDKYPIIRPLVTFEKQEAIAIAQKIGTFDISIRSCPDSCTVFMPDSPITRGKVSVAIEEEQKLYPDIENLIDQALQQMEIFKF